MSKKLTVSTAENVEMIAVPMSAEEAAMKEAE